MEALKPSLHANKVFILQLLEGALNAAATTLCILCSSNRVIVGFSLGHRSKENGIAESSCAEAFCKGGCSISGLSDQNCVLILFG